MGLIPTEEIERLKREISLEALVRAKGVELVKSGDNLVGRCPFHSPDKTPSFIVTPAKGLWHCMGACQKGGSVIDFVMASEGASFRKAVEVLRAGGPIQPSTPEGAALVRLPKLAPLSESTEDGELMERVVAHYHATLKESPEALEYLRARGLEHPEVIARFRLGFSNRTLGYRLPAGETKVGAELRGRLGEIGILRATGHEHLRGSLVIPLFDADGRAVQLYGRKIRNDLGESVPKHLYLPGPHRGVFNREALGESDEVILCEALVDALTFWCAGYRNVTSAYGVEGFTEEIAEALATAGVQVVKIAFDRDEAGDRGAEKASAKLKAMGIETQRVLFPKGMDANQYALKLGPAEKSLGLVLRQAEWMIRDSASVSVASTMPEATAARTLQSASRGATSSPPEPPKSSGGLDAAPPSGSEREGTQARAASAPEPPIPSLAASPSASPSTSPASPRLTARVQAEQKGDEWIYRFGDRTWRVCELSKAGARGDMRVKLGVERASSRGFFVDTVDLYASRQRAGFIKAVSSALELEERAAASELEQIFADLEERRAAKMQAAAAPSPTSTMSEDERREALALLHDPRLLDRVLEDLKRAGSVGEETNKLIAYLAATSRKLEEPLAIVIESSSAAGKSSLMDAVLQLLPEEERVQYSAMTAQSLYYMGAQNLRHKVLAIVEEEGAERASYALKLLQSEGELTIASAGKDPTTGKLVTHDYRVAGPVMIFLTTTAIEVDEELLNRCVVLTVDEGREQTRAIHERQRSARTLEGMIARADRQQIRRLHRNAQRLLRTLVVVNPFAEDLSFTSHATRTRRDHVKYLTLIESVTLLHQYQREVKRAVIGGQPVEYIEATKEDVAIATKLAHAALGRSLDELPAQTRRLLHELESLVAERVKLEGVERSTVRFTRREVRERTGWGNTQLKVHMRRLEELEYLLMHRLRGPHVHYELVYDGVGKGGEPFVLGLGYDQPGSGRGGDRSGAKGDRSALGGDRSGVGRALVGGESRPVSGEETTGNTAPIPLNGRSVGPNAKYVREAARVGS